MINAAPSPRRTEMLETPKAGGPKKPVNGGFGQTRIGKMRLVCPNCSAQYEIDGSMIPADGRDVQCSNCGHTWYELPGPSAETKATSQNLFHEDADKSGGSGFDPDEEDAFDESAEETLSSRAATRPTSLSRTDFADLSAEDFASDFLASDDDETVDDQREENEPEPETSLDETSSAMAALASAARDSAEDDDDFAEEDEVWGDSDEPTWNDDDPDDDTDVMPIAPSPGTPRRPADMAALDILREEAERELSQRRAPPSDSLETQTDLGLDDIRNRRTPSRALRARMAHLGEEIPEEDTPEEEFRTEVSDRMTRLAEPSSEPDDDDDGYEEPRRDLLPDIEEINSTLRKPYADAGGADARQRSGFRAGFLLMVLLAGAAIFAYAQAPAIARALPETESSLISYVDWANGLRDQVDDLIGN